MESRNHSRPNRPLSTISTASIWTQRTLAGMGLDIEYSNSSITLANTEDNTEASPLRHWQVPYRELDTGCADCQQDDAGTVQQPHHIHEGQSSQGRNPSDKDVPLDPNSSATKRINLARVWWLEIASGLLVVAMVAALVGTVYPYQNQPLPQWPYTLSINTIVAFYSEVMRAAMILVLGECLSQLKWSWFTQPRPLDHIEHFDNASRGPWGSLTLLWAIRLRAILPSIGAVMMILTLLLVPFTQQIVQFYSCTVPDPTSNASIPKTNYASAGSSVHIGAGLNSISPEVQATMNSGIYDSSPKQVTFTCPTGNCTFEGVYHSMGWCSQCVDVSDQIETTTSRGQHNFTLPSSNLTATAGISTFIMEPFDEGIQAILGWGNTGFNLSDTPWGNRGYGAAECKIQPCIRGYTATVAAGNLTESLVSTYMTNWEPGDVWASVIDVPCLNDAEKQTLHDAGYEFSLDKTTWLAYNLSADARSAFNPTTLNLTETTIRPECIYQAFYYDFRSLAGYLGTLFSGRVSFAPGVLGGSTVPQFIFQEGNVTFSTIDGTFSRLAQALTVWNREEGGENATGSVYRSDTCVSARWAWLAYPLALALGTAVLLAWTVDRARRDEGSAHDYKSSSLALLFHRLGDVGSEGPTRGIESKGSLLESARATRVAFRSTDNNKAWRFVEGILVGVYSGLIFSPALSIVGYYFSKKRALAMALASTGSPVGGVIYPVVMTNFLLNPGLGFTWGLGVCGFLSLFLLAIASVPIRPTTIRRRGEFILIEAFLKPFRSRRSSW
ncbi:hypothetical protein F4820DRAFT_455779 [Hypoxylon rubiginosum]|uniref:Uncharacterized protein n=1 Tax=Hypoxylon rubiginosum TaxID=110542 RepID=A0ACB9ZCX8_9PEZI|nr:hypothetical protein F4820DRAFT_455779 [Hypoxylon rubiginosum]